MLAWGCLLFPPTHVTKVPGSTQPWIWYFKGCHCSPLPLNIAPPTCTFPNRSDSPKFFGVQDTERPPLPTPNPGVSGLLPPFGPKQGLALTVTEAWWRSSQAARGSPHTGLSPWSRSSVEDTFPWGDSRPLLPQSRPTGKTECLPLPCPLPQPRLPLSPPCQT